MKAIRYDKYSSSSELASRIASRIRSQGTKAEKLLGSQLWRLGLRFIKNAKHLPGQPDIVFRKERIAIFCDGDFWHGRDWKAVRAKLSKGSNSEYWVNKIRNNRIRDRRYNATLEEMGWKVLRFWESEINAHSLDIANIIKTVVVERRRA